jgi:hypothetical protein
MGLNDQHRRLIFHLYDFEAGTFEETIWRTWDAPEVEKRVQEWKGKGYRLVLEGRVVNLDPRYKFNCFIPAGAMERLWRANDPLGGTTLGAWQFIWHAGTPPPDDSPESGEKPVPK